LASNNTVWWVLGGAAVALVGLGVLTARSAHAAAPPAEPIVPPAPIPLSPHPAPAPPAPNAIVRQGSLNAPTSPAVVRVLQRQLQQLGYHITRVDGRLSPELRQATIAFENDLHLDRFTSNLELLLAVDTRYGEVFDPTNSRGY
jgi:hypothetical protein